MFCSIHELFWNVFSFDCNDLLHPSRQEMLLSRFPDDILVYSNDEDNNSIFWFLCAFYPLLFWLFYLVQKNWKITFTVHFSWFFFLFFWCVIQINSLIQSPKWRRKINFFRASNRNAMNMFREIIKIHKVTPFNSNYTKNEWEKWRSSKWELNCKAIISNGIFSVSQFKTINRGKNYGYRTPQSFCFCSLIHTFRIKKKRKCYGSRRSPITGFNSCCYVLCIIIISIEKPKKENEFTLNV